MEVYCLRCKRKREMLDPEPVTWRNGLSAYRGRCPGCNGILSALPKKPQP